MFLFPADIWFYFPTSPAVEFPAKLKMKKTGRK